MDSAEAHERLTRATGAQPYTPPLEQEPPPAPESVQPTPLGQVPSDLAGIELEAAGRAFEQGLQGPQLMQSFPDGSKVEMTPSLLPVGAMSGMFATPLLPAANGLADPEQHAELVELSARSQQHARECLDEAKRHAAERDLALWLHAEAAWRRDASERRRAAQAAELRISGRVREAHVAEIRRLTAERDALQDRVDAQKQALDDVRAQNDGVVEKVDAALGHRYHKPTVHYSVPHVAEKAAAELRWLEAQRAAALARSFGEAMASIGDFLECTSELLDQLDLVEDDDGRAIWLTAGEVELDQWLGRLVAARDAMRDRLAPRE